MTRGTVIRVLAAVSLLVGGGVHLRLYYDGYKDFPNHNLGNSFLANVAASVIVAVALLVTDRWPVLVAGIAVADGSLLAFAMSRTSTGIFGFNERGWNPSPEAALAIVAEIAAALLLLAVFVQKPAHSAEF